MYIAADTVYDLSMTKTHEIIEFEDGSTAVIPDSWPAGRADDVVGVDSGGDLVAESDGFQYSMTWCCGASVKGYSDGTVGCRVCCEESEVGCGGSPWGDVIKRVES